MIAEIRQLWSSWQYGYHQIVSVPCTQYTVRALAPGRCECACASNLAALLAVSEMLTLTRWDQFVGQQCVPGMLSFPFSLILAQTFRDWTDIQNILDIDSSAANEILREFCVLHTAELHRTPRNYLHPNDLGKRSVAMSCKHTRRTHDNVQNERFFILLCLPTCQFPTPSVRTSANNWMHRR